MHLRVVCISVCVVALSLCLGGRALATAPEDAAAVRVPLAERSTEARQAALREALRRYLVRVTGRPGAAGDSAARALLAEPERFVQQYRYLGDADGGRKLAAIFDAQAVRDALGQRNVAVWAPDRPAVLLWLALDGRAGRQLVGGGSGGDVDAAVRARMREYGLAVIFPLLDLQDRRAVRFSDIAGGFGEVVVDASERYPTPIVATAALRAGGGRWSGRYTLYSGGRQLAAGDLGADTREAALDELARALAGALQSEYALPPETEAGGRLVIWVRGVRSAAAFARSERLLAGLPGISEPRLERSRGDAVRLRLTTRGGPAQARETLKRASGLRYMANGRIPAPRPEPGAKGDDSADSKAAAERSEAPAAESQAVTHAVVDPLVGGTPAAAAGTGRADEAAPADDLVFRLTR